MSVLKSLKSFFTGDFGAAPSFLSRKEDGRLTHPELVAAITTLLVEVALADDRIKEAELQEIVEFLGVELGLSEDVVDDIFGLAVEAQRSLSTIESRLAPLVQELGPVDREYIHDLVSRVCHADHLLCDREAKILTVVGALLGKPEGS